MRKLSLGIDLACRADHVASLADEQGRFIWQGRRFRTTTVELDALTEELGEGDELTVVLEPTRNAWAAVAAHFLARGDTVVVVPPEQSADLRRYYSKHAKTDGLDSRLLARLPLVHPDGLHSAEDLGPAGALKRAVRRRASLVRVRDAAGNRLCALLELLGPGYCDALGWSDYPKAALAVLRRYADPRALRKLGKGRLTQLLQKASRGRWGERKAEELFDAAAEAISLWEGGGLDFEELAWDIASEVRVHDAAEGEIASLERRIEHLYRETDPSGIMVSAPAVGLTAGAGILGRLGDARRFANLGGVRSFSGMVPGTDRSGTAEGRPGLTKAGDPGLRRDLFLAADAARKVDPQLAAVYYRLVVHRGLHHTAAVCHVATKLLTRLAACWRKQGPYVLRDTDGRVITEAEGRVIVADRYRVPEEVRRARRKIGKAKELKQRTDRRSQESTLAAPAPGPSTAETSEEVA